MHAPSPLPSPLWPDLQSLEIWFDLNATDPAAVGIGAITGLTATCVAPPIGGNNTQPLSVFPGAGLPDATLTFSGGLANVTVQRGDYLNSVQGVGGNGPVQEIWSCQPGEVLTGIHVAWQPNPSTQANTATGMRVYCEVPTACLAGGRPNVSASVPTPSPPPPPRSGLDLPPITGGTPQFVETDWFGPKKGPGAYGAVCPCGSVLSQWVAWSDAPTGVSQGLTGLSGYCAGSDAVQFEVRLLLAQRCCC